MLVSKSLLATVWGHALLKFAKENDMQLPSSLAAAAPYLNKKNIDFIPVGRLTTPSAEQVPRARPQVLGDQQPRAHQIAEDLVGQELPHAAFQGKDAQLEAAVRYLQELIKKEPVEVPKHPPYPDKRK